MARKIAFHLDALVVVVLIFVVSFGFNLYQRYQYEDLLQKYVDIEWEKQNIAINLQEAKKRPENCRGLAPGIPAN